MQAKLTPSQRLAAFVSLDWYDGAISFLFRFVAKTSEPLLAAGVILSAADFLQKGQLMAHNPTLAAAWSWAQALAIEASTGPVLVFALMAYRSKDQVKGVLYTVLAALLFVVGAAMLLLQMVSSVTGFSETSIPIALLYTLFVLRVLVSGGYVALSCTKHMRFSGQSNETPSVPPAPTGTITDETVQLILSKLAKLDQLEQALATIQITEQQRRRLLLDSPHEQEQAATDEAAPSIEWLVQMLPDVSRNDIEKVLEARKEGIARRDICASLKWGSARYTAVVKPVLDAYEQQQQNVTSTQ